MSTTRTRPDRCPGILRPWPASDGLLARLRLVGGRLPLDVLTALVELAERHGDGRVRLTNRTNLQLRGLPDEGNHHLPAPLLDELAALGLLPSREHDLVRNIMTSAGTGWFGGRVDLRPVAEELETAILCSAGLAELPGKFLFCLDDGRGDLAGHWCDLGLVVLDEHQVQLRHGSHRGPVVPRSDAVGELVQLAERFCAERGHGETAAWHVDELEHPLLADSPPDPRLPGSAEPLRFGAVADGIEHLEVGQDGLDRGWLERLAGCDEVLVTPWYGLLVRREEVR